MSQVKTASFVNVVTYKWGQMGYTIKIKCKEYEQHRCLYQWDKLAMAEYSINEGHCKNFKDTMVLATTAS
jgi:hypothetical protein